MCGRAATIIDGRTLLKRRDGFDRSTHELRIAPWMFNRITLTGALAGEAWIPVDRWTLIVQTGVATGGRMTLFLLLVTIACVFPVAAVASNGSQLGVVGSVVGYCLAIVAGILQFVGHHKVAYAISDKLEENWRTRFLVVIYYLGIFLLGILLVAVTLHGAKLSVRVLDLACADNSRSAAVPC